MRDLRRARRSRMIKSLQIVSTDADIDCVILNLSKTGALIYLPKPLDLPEMMILRWPDGTERPARSCWRQDTDVGFEFLDANSNWHLVSEVMWIRQGFVNSN